MPSMSTVQRMVMSFITIVRPYARAVAAFVAGVAITLNDEHAYVTGLVAMLGIVAVSLIVHDGPATMFNRVTWWLSLVVFALAALGLVMGKTSDSTTLSLVIALGAFETVLAIARADRLWAWSTALFVSVLCVLYFAVPIESRTTVGLIGAWAIIVGVFEVIAVFDMHVKLARSRVGEAVAAATANAARTSARAATTAVKATVKAGVAVAKKGAATAAQSRKAVNRGTKR